MTADEVFSIVCIPEGEELGPSPEELENFYLSLENGNIPDLNWKCPGRKAASPKTTKEEPKAATDNIEKELQQTKTDFDFMDDVALPTMRVRSQNSTPKGSAKKKTANFAGVIDALKKQRLSSSHSKDSGST